MRDEVDFDGGGAGRPPTGLLRLLIRWLLTESDRRVLLDEMDELGQIIEEGRGARETAKWRDRQLRRAVLHLVWERLVERHSIR